MSELAKVMTEENRAVVLPRFFGCSREEAKQLVAELAPAAVVPRRTVVTVVPLLAPVAPAPVVVQPVGRDRTHPPAFKALLKKARAGQSHVQPGATDEQVLS